MTETAETMNPELSAGAGGPAELVLLHAVQHQQRVMEELELVLEHLGKCDDARLMRARGHLHEAAKLLPF